MIDMIATGKYIPFGNMKNYMSLLYIDNLIDIIIKCIKNNKSNKKLYFIADDELLRADESYNIIAGLLGVKPHTIYLPKVLVWFFAGIIEIFYLLINKLPKFPERFVNNAASNYACSLNKIKKELKWKQPFSFYEGMKITVRWYKNNKNE